MYGMVVLIRNFLFDMGILPVKSFPYPVINVGNLAAGGTGKSPHVEYLVKLIQSKFEVATLSRGYGRKTSGFVEVNENSTFFDVGDEPRMFYSKYPNVKVAVDANRKRGIERLKELYPKIKCIILDDAFQHRSVSAGLNILLTEYSRLYINDLLLPSGYLREPQLGAKRADFIIVTKCPSIFSPVDARAIRTKLNLKEYQTVYFSYFKYRNLVHVYDKQKEDVPEMNQKLNVILLTGIARAKNMYFAIKDKVKSIEHLNFPDHHVFTMSDINRVTKAYRDLKADNKIILTTEKDAMRLLVPGIEEELGGLPIYYVPVEVEFHGNDKKEFDENILTYVKRYTGGY
tara:strand:- start:13979 stop:15010 length:1032 start_codon:yes stop_codon:yes gene_type:complete